MIEALRQAPAYHRVETVRAFKIHGIRNGRFITVKINGRDVELDAIDLVIAGNTILAGQVVYINDNDDTIKLQDEEYLEKFALTL